MSPIRAFRQLDCQQVSDLRWRAFGCGEAPAPAAVADYFREIFLDGPWCDPASPSLVMEEKDGAIVGFLGILTRPMLFRGSEIKVATSSQWMVGPKAGPMPGLELINRLFRGSHDLLLADDANDKSRAVWERFGGHTSHLFSLRWLRILRPAGFFASMASTGNTDGSPHEFLKGIGRGIDTLLGRLGVGSLSEESATLTREPLDAARLLECYSAQESSMQLRPLYEARSLSWLLDRAKEKVCFGSFKGTMLRDRDRRPAGWYGYYVHPGTTAQVLTMGACGHRMNAVLDHLFQDTWREGAVAVSGRMEPAYLTELSDKLCVFKREFGWTLVYAKRPEILQAIDCGEGSLSRLDGEWWMRFPELEHDGVHDRARSAEPVAV